MLYDEFVKGTGCRETEKNYQVYKELEAIYMNSDLSKDEIYEIGKMRVDNTLTEQEQDEIRDLENAISVNLERCQYLENFIYYGTYKDITQHHKEHIQEIHLLSRMNKSYKEQIKDIKDRVNQA